MKNRLAVSAMLLVFAAWSVSDAQAALDAAATRGLFKEVQFEGLGMLTTSYVAVPGMVFDLVEVQTAHGVPTKRYGDAHLEMVEMDLPASGIVMLARAITDFSAGTPSRPSISTQVHVLDGDPADAPWTDLGLCSLASVIFPELRAAGRPSSAPVRLRLFPSTSAALAAPRSMTPGPVLPALRMASNAFSVTIPGVDGSGFLSVAPIEIRAARAGHASVYGADMFRTNLTGTANVSNLNFTITVTGAALRGLRAWVDANASAPTYREIAIQYLDPITNAPVVALRGVGVGLMSLRPLPQQESVATLAEATFFLERWIVTPISQKQDKLDFVMPQPSFRPKR